jgi:hypothetical protein
MINNSLPLTQSQAIILSIVIVLILIGVNVLNSYINARVYKKQNDILLKEISEELLIYSGYLKEPNTEENQSAETARYIDS